MCHVEVLRPMTKLVKGELSSQSLEIIVHSISLRVCNRLIDFSLNKRTTAIVDLMTYKTYKKNRKTSEQKSVF